MWLTIGNDVLSHSSKRFKIEEANKAVRASLNCLTWEKKIKEGKAWNFPFSGLTCQYSQPISQPVDCFGFYIFLRGVQYSPNNTETRQWQMWLRIVGDRGRGHLFSKILLQNWVGMFDQKPLFCPIVMFFFTSALLISGSVSEQMTVAVLSVWRSTPTWNTHLFFFFWWSTSFCFLFSQFLCLMSALNSH